MPIRHGVAVFAAVLTLMVGAGAAQASEAAPSIRVLPHHGPPGTEIRVRGEGFYWFTHCPIVTVTFTDHRGRTALLGKTDAHYPDGTFHLAAQVPSDVARGLGYVTAKQPPPNDGHCINVGLSASHRFKVTMPATFLAGGRWRPVMWLQLTGDGFTA